VDGASFVFKINLLRGEQVRVRVVAMEMAGELTVYSDHGSMSGAGVQCLHDDWAIKRFGIDSLMPHNDTKDRVVASANNAG